MKIIKNKIYPVKHTSLANGLKTPATPSILLATFFNGVNILFYFSIIFFIITCSVHIFNKKRVANAVGSSGGRIAAIVWPRPPDCTPQTCTCNTTYLVTITPYGGNDLAFCIPTANTPITGPTILITSIGYQMLGYWTATQPTAISTNWGTSL